MRNEILRMENVSLRKNGVEILNAFHLNIFAGEIVELVSLDSFGKEELINLILENSELYYGRVFFAGVLVNSYRRASANYSRNAAAVIDKKRRLVEDLTVADNVFVFRKGFKKFFINRKTLCNQIKPFAEQFSIGLNGTETVAHLSALERRGAEIIRAKVAGAKLLIIDDVSDLGSDIGRFHEALKRFAADGSAVLYVCGRRGESMAASDRIAIMEGGRLLGIRDGGESIESYFPDFASQKRPAEENSNPVLTFNGVYAGALADVSFSVKAGECAALLDADGSASGVVIDLINGEKTPARGEVLLCGARVNKTKKLTEFIFENPLKKNLFPDFSYLDNLCFPLGNKKAFLWRGARFKKSVARELEFLDDIFERDITGLTPESLYMLTYYRAMLANPKLIACRQPFLGADTYLRRVISQLIQKFKERGIATLILISTFSDSFPAADRLIVIKEGKVIREYAGAELEKLNQ